MDKNFEDNYYKHLEDSIVKKTEPKETNPIVFSSDQNAAVMLSELGKCFKAGDLESVKVILSKMTGQNEEEEEDEEPDVKTSEGEQGEANQNEPKEEPKEDGSTLDDLEEEEVNVLEVLRGDAEHLEESIAYVKDEAIRTELESILDQLYIKIGREERDSKKKNQKED